MLDAAVELFGRRRFHEVRMEDIAAAAEVGKGTLYRYFTDKEKLYAALLAQAADQLSEQTHRAAQGATAARGRLVALATAILTYFDEHPHLVDLINHAEAMHRFGPEF